MRENGGPRTLLASLYMCTCPSYEEPHRSAISIFPEARSPEAMATRDGYQMTHSASGYPSRQPIVCREFSLGPIEMRVPVRRGSRGHSAHQGLRTGSLSRVLPFQSILERSLRKETDPQAEIDDLQQVSPLEKLSSFSSAVGSQLMVQLTSTNLQHPKRGQTHFSLGFMLAPWIQCARFEYFRGLHCQSRTHVSNVKPPGASTMTSVLSADEV